MVKLSKTNNSTSLKSLRERGLPRNKIFSMIEENDFIMFAKDKRANKSSVSGYYASVKLENSSTEKAELFTIASEIQESSK